ncbi:preprotein translocase subunit SecG [Uruburuella testudinis]|uniref:Protein-export membrane protein SecG n=1 Tax=Uruburuella testudinis TaxID=1282863 RepID=A0ABY4DSD3_9NEIS|nr:preprotein translocase subunit SecG [Uruburuella testudinis]UOO81615.1 preprotein translocase subunit SecG [Uruburuella testudinis]
MEAFKTVIWIVNIFAALAVIVLVLMQQGKGADAGATFGSGTGSAQGVFGSGGNANFLSRSTAIAATLFFVSCMALVYIHTNAKSHGLDFSTVEQSQPAQTQQQPLEQIPAQNSGSSPQQ